MDFVGPLVLCATLGGGDYWSSRAAIRRGGVELNQFGPTFGAVQTCATAAAIDIVVQKTAPKAKWPVRVVLVAAGGYLVYRNSRVGRER